MENSYPEYLVIAVYIMRIEIKFKIDAKMDFDKEGMYLCRIYATK